MTAAVASPPDLAGDAHADGRRAASVLAAASVLVGALNYATSLIAVHLLAPSAFSAAAASQALLLVVGTVATASTPWLVTQVLERRDSSAESDRQVVWFSWVVNALQGVAAGVVVVLVASTFVDRPTSVLAALATVLVFLATTPAGWLQGRRRFTQLAALRVGEATVKLGLAVGLLVAGAGPAAVVGGIGGGAAAALVVGAWWARADLGVARGALRLRALWRTSLQLASVQGCTALLVSLDVLLVEQLVRSGGEAGSYQAAAVLGKTPVFVASALAAVDFGRLSAAASEARARPGAPGSGAPAPERTGSAAALLLVCAPLVALAWTVPDGLVELAFPEGYADVTTLLPLAAVVGSLAALLLLVTTCRLALGAPGTAPLLLVAASGSAGLAVVGAERWGAAGVATALAAGLLVTVVVAGAPLRAVLLPRAGAWGTAAVLALLAAVAGASLHARPWAWSTVAVLLGGASLAATARALGGRRPRDAAAGRAPVQPTGAPRRPTVLHLAFEDHRRPGAGGGSRRTHEVDRRLAADFDVVVVASTWRGAKDRVEEGVAYRHVGLAGGYVVELLSYFAALPLLLLRTRADVVVEDFAAPFSTIGAPRWTRRPVVGVVQWLNAREKARQYHLPLHLVERWGVRQHSTLISVSDGVARELTALNPRAAVHVLPNGVEATALGVEGRRGDDVVFLGRLEIAQKGLDVLLQAWALVHGRAPGRLLLAGDGPDRRELEQTARRLGLEDSVVFLGRVAPDQRLALLRRARLTVMPSRFETFGLVALESLSVGTPVVAADVACLRDVVVPGPGRLVPVDDAEALAAAVLEMACDRGLADRHEATARGWAARFTWEAVAERQGEVLRSLL